MGTESPVVAVSLEIVILRYSEGSSNERKGLPESKRPLSTS